ncbi:putative sodium/potassium/calcium exchanger [Christensenella tenuis]|uniref:Uncharacterized protein n=1 Tax=Christensenella tenuis TaxID=2763033 RepID=A0ABR7EC89_9FIRM|nr:hypothetical protein [Christensenella tenuis]MBC5646971.1 hypothetical protein [Christensenella tenuis]
MMEAKTNKTNKIPFIILAIIVLAVCVIYFVGFGGYLNSAAAASGLTLGLPMVLYYLYLYGGMMIACIAVLMIMVLTLKNMREFFAKIFVWGTFLLAMLASAGFFGNLAQVSSFTSIDQGIAYFATYVPYVALVVASISLIVQWDSSNRKKANMISLVCTLISAAMTILLISNIMTQMKSMLDTLGTMQTAYIFQYTFMIMTAVACSIMCMLYFYVTLNRRKFDCHMIGMTDEEAEIVERIEARVDEIADEVEELAAEGEAIIKAETEIQKEIDGQIGETEKEAAEILEDTDSVSIEIGETEEK